MFYEVKFSAVDPVSRKRKMYSPVCKARDEDDAREKILAQDVYSMLKDKTFESVTKVD